MFGTQGSRETTTGSRLDLTVLETPATVDIIDGDAIRARMDTSVLEASTRSAGFTTESNPGNGSFSVCARGFCGQGAVTKLYDGTNYYNGSGHGHVPVRHLERRARRGFEGTLVGALRRRRHRRRDQRGPAQAAARAKRRSAADRRRGQHAVHRRRLHERARRLGRVSRGLQQQPVRQLGPAERGQRSRDAGVRRAVGRRATTWCYPRGSTAATRTRCGISASRTRTATSSAISSA